MTKILILNVGCQNKGNLALVISTISTIQNYIPNAQFSLMGAKKIDYRIAKLPMAYAGRFVAENEGGTGLCKVLVGKKYGEVLGVHMLGNPSSEIIYGACLAIEAEMTLKEMEEVVFPHPTVSEIFRETVFDFGH